jgi:hypothetical protein
MAQYSIGFLKHLRNSPLSVKPEGSDAILAELHKLIAESLEKKAKTKLDPKTKGLQKKNNSRGDNSSKAPEWMSHSEKDIAADQSAQASMDDASKHGMDPIQMFKKNMKSQSLDSIPMTADEAKPSKLAEKDVGKSQQLDPIQKFRLKMKVSEPESKPQTKSSVSHDSVNAHIAKRDSSIKMKVQAVHGSSPPKEVIDNLDPIQKFRIQMKAKEDRKNPSSEQDTKKPGQSSESEKNLGQVAAPQQNQPIFTPSQGQALTFEELMTSNQFQPPIFASNGNDDGPNFDSLFIQPSIGADAPRARGGSRFQSMFEGEISNNQQASQPIQPPSLSQHNPRQLRTNFEAPRPVEYSSIISPGLEKPKSILK